ncbi:hypothetical protein K4A87_00025 [Xanthomonas fragariae]|uniref:hypothetical protein n=1 Tax=Xanthomonas fragariae TaxID=48664 RepID=UPI001ABEA3A4|nr:hypothetical protein [Xanthomonas fragariae]UKR54282.1 hypothetical protein K4A87_00025 [Xanthomonas fragariae]
MSLQQQLFDLGDLFNFSNLSTFTAEYSGGAGARARTQKTQSSASHALGRA